MYRNSLKRSMAVLIVMSVLMSITPISISTVRAEENVLGGGVTATPRPGNPPEPLVPPSAVLPGPVVPLGLGASFTMFAADASGVAASEGITVDGSGAVVANGTWRTGPFTVPNSAPFMNGNFGTSTVNVKSGGRLGKSAHNACWGYITAAVGYGEGGEVVYTPKAGWLSGVDTKLSAFYTHEGATGIEAVVNHAGGSTVVPLVPNNHGKPSLTCEYLDIGTFKSVISVTIRTIGGTNTHYTYLPPVTFKVINDYNSANPNPVLPERKYVKPNTPTASAKPVTPNATPNVTSPVSINEVCSDNVTGIFDQYSERSDWFELYNNSGTAVDISFWGVADGQTNQFKYRFPPGAAVPANGYLVVRASGKGAVKNGEYHTNFKISKGGEKLMLSNAQGGIVSVLDFSELKEDKTFSRYPNGSNSFRITNPTPNAANIDGEVFVIKPEFSHQSGFYVNPFDLTITGSGGTIRYTTDGSDPTAASPVFGALIPVVNRAAFPNVLSDIIYLPRPDGQNNPYPIKKPKVTVDKAMIVRAAVFDENGNSSEITTKTYFVDHTMAGHFNNLPVLSVVTDPKSLYDAETGIFTHADVNLYDGKNAVIPDPLNHEWERPAHITLFEGDGSLAFSQNVGIKMRGLGSSVIPQKGLNFYARSEYGKTKIEYPLFGNLLAADGSPISEFNDFCIKTGGRMEATARYIDAAGMTLCKELDLPRSDARSCVVFIDGEYWGTYFLQERASNDYIEEHYGVPKEDVILMKGQMPKGDSTPEDLAMYDEERYHFLIETDFSIESNYRLLDSKYDLEEMMLYYAANLNMVNRDWGAYNYALWRSRSVTDQPYQDGKWRFIVNDLDASYMTFGDETPLEVIRGSHPAAVAMSKNPSLKRRFANACLDVFNSTFESHKVYEEFRYWHDELTPMYNANIGRWNYDEGIKTQINGLFSSVVGRKAYTLKQFKDGFGLTGSLTHLNVRVNNVEGGRVKVNSINPDFSNGSWDGFYFTDYTTKLVAEPNPGYQFAGWTASNETALSDNTDPATYVTLNVNGSQVTANFVPDDSTPGSRYNPYKITSEADLIAMSNNISTDYGQYGNKYYELTNDIVFSNTNANNLTPIGTASAPFMGNFNGNGHTISGIKTNLAAQGQGLFGYVGSAGVVKNVGVTGSSFTGTNNIGGIAGNNAGLIENCYSTGTVSGVNTIGGIVGNNNGGIIKNCYSIATVNSESSGTLGGIAGKTEQGGSVVNCYSLINPVGKNEGGTVTLSEQKNPSQFASGEVSYRLNESGVKSVWAKGESAPVFANGTTNKAIIFEVKFVVDGLSDRFAYTYSGGTVQLPPDGKTQWKAGNDAFTSQTPVTGNITVTGTVQEDFILSLTGRDIKVTSIIEISSATLVAASYQDSQLMDIRLFTVNQGQNETQTYPLNQSFNMDSNLTVKIMLLKNLISIAPVVVSKSVTIEPTPPPNLALSATATASSTYPGYFVTAVNDGVVSGYPVDASKEWAAHNEKVGAWVQLNWSTAKTVRRIRLFDRPNNFEQILSGTLTFSDGTTLSVGELPNLADEAFEITFEPKTITWVRFTVGSVKQGTLNTGLAEFEVY